MNQTGLEDDWSHSRRTASGSVVKGFFFISVKSACLISLVLNDSTFLPDSAV